MPSQLPFWSSSSMWRTWKCSGHGCVAPWAAMHAWQTSDTLATPPHSASFRSFGSPDTSALTAPGNIWPPLISSPHRFGRACVKARTSSNPISIECKHRPRREGCKGAREGSHDLGDSSRLPSNVKFARSIVITGEGRPLNRRRSCASSSALWPWGRRCRACAEASRIAAAWEMASVDPISSSDARARHTHPSWVLPGWIAGSFKTALRWLGHIWKAFRISSRGLCSRPRHAEKVAFSLKNRSSLSGGPKKKEQSSKVKSK
mmetsp:Transcript_28934/g.77955  ORF Transcript_28934/g.77955 Transcript_28934/m.77955 type:complete len:261 (-) Transcript_28934:398-1180(-)